MKLSRASCWVALIFAFASIAQAADKQPNGVTVPENPMTFEYTSDGGNIKGSDWIAAEGKITRNTPKSFQEFLKKSGARDTFVQFDSPGGNLLAAIKLGELIRAAKLDTSVGGTVFHQNGGMWSGTRPGICASACAYAFLGGKMRIASGNEIGVHQFYDSDALTDPQKKAFSAIDLSINQVLSGIVLDYALKMGVKPGLISLADSTPPWKIHFLTTPELKNLRVTNAGFVDSGWSIKSMLGGAALTLTSTYSTRPPVTVSIACRQGEPGAFLFFNSSTSYLDRWLMQGYGARHPLTAKQIRASLRGLVISGNGWKKEIGSNAILRVEIGESRNITLLAYVGPHALDLIRRGGRITFDPEFPFIFASFLYVDTQYDIPIPDLNLALRNCIR